MARNTGTGDATFDSAAQEHYNTSGSATSSTYLQRRLIIIRLHCSTTYIDTAYCCRWSGVVSVCHICEPCMEVEVQIPHANGQF